MDSALAKQWIALLLSGEYAQGQEMLRDPKNQYCCLGVLCDMYVKKGDGEWGQFEEGSKYYYKSNGDHSAYSLVQHVIDQTYLPRADETILSEMNDDGCTFVEIADYIERKYIKGEEVDYHEYIQTARERICPTPQGLTNDSKENT